MRGVFLATKKALETYLFSCSKWSIRYRLPSGEKGINRTVSHKYGLAEKLCMR